MAKRKLPAWRSRLDAGTPGLATAAGAALDCLERGNLPGERCSPDRRWLCLRRREHRRQSRGEMEAAIRRERKEVTCGLSSRIEPVAPRVNLFFSIVKRLGGVRDMARDAAGSSDICLEVCETTRDATTVTFTYCHVHPVQSQLRQISAQRQQAGHH